MEPWDTQWDKEQSRLINLTSFPQQRRGAKTELDEIGTPGLGGVLIGVIKGVRQEYKIQLLGRNAQNTKVLSANLSKYQVRNL